MTATKPKAAEVADVLTPYVDTVLKATAYAQATREKIDAVHAAILAEQDVRDDEGKPIREPSSDWLMAEKYREPYYAECDRRNKAMGYELEPGHCPALIAENVQRDAEHAMIAAAERFFPGVTVNKLLCGRESNGKRVGGLETLREYIDLLIKLVVNKPGYRRPRI